MCEPFQILMPIEAWQDAWPDREQAIHNLMRKLKDCCGMASMALTCVLTDDAAVQDLNRTFRGKDAPTNVLSFPDGTPDPETGQVYLGDVILALETIRREAATQNKPFSFHAQHLLVHGVLHLLGYTHDEERDATRMEMLEQSILAAVGIPDPYAC